MMTSSSTSRMFLARVLPAVALAAVVYYSVYYWAGPGHENACQMTYSRPSFESIAMEVTAADQVWRTRDATSRLAYKYRLLRYLEAREDPLEANPSSVQPVLFVPGHLGG